MNPFNSVRDRQAKRLWKIFRTVPFLHRHFVSLDHYLESIPPVPRWAPETEERYPILVYAEKPCNVFGLASTLGIHVSNPRHLSYLKDDVGPVTGWLRVRLDHGTRTRPLPEVRAGLSANESVLGLLDGFSLHLHHPTLVRDTGLHLPGFYYSSRRQTCLLHYVSGQLRFNWGQTAAGVLKDFVLPVRTTAPPIG